ncbi:MAG: NERD domain-containing protein [Lachnospiraceae bacterium]|nr:NERD domain-containing protein [Lachnospiraceae bacterium]
MANMYPKNISEYMPTDSERIVYQELKNQLPDSFDVFYSVKWTSFENGKLVKSEADFIVTSPEYGFICFEVKGGTGIRIKDNVWNVEDTFHGNRELCVSPYDQAEKSMYYFNKTFSNKYNMPYQGIYGAGVIFPFYPIGEDVELDNRHRNCTIDSGDLNKVYDCIKKMFRLWGGVSFGRRFYPRSQHNAFLELVRERIVISAAAGALVKYKEQQLNVINRVQDNYIYFISNKRQFYIRGGAGTGKTWIAMKMALKDAEEFSMKVLFVCASPMLANMVRGKIGIAVDVVDVHSLFNRIIEDYDLLKGPYYEGIGERLKADIPRYDAIFVDEAQDFAYEWASVIRKLLVDNENSCLGVFYDDVQVLREDSFGAGFGIESLPYLLHENIRNTANIYNWVAKKTKLGTDMIANPVEGPTPITEYIDEPGQLTLTLENLFFRYLIEEYLSNYSLVLLTDNVNMLLNNYPKGIARWNLVRGYAQCDCEIGVFSVEEYKGLESDMVVYFHAYGTSENMNYIAYTRAKYYLLELVRRY